ncbi:xanthine dehydrogenase small subunit [Nocardia sp. NPDC055049]
MAEPVVIVNGETLPLSLSSPHVNVLDFLRGRGLTGAKEGCAEGECGACSILVARPGVTTETDWVAINACLMPAAALDGQEVITAEGLGSSALLHPVQREMATRGGSQCGYCTPGFICSMAAEYYRPDRVGEEATNSSEHGPNGFDLHALSGNLCRCTGYRPIRDAAYALGHPEPEDPLARRREAAPPGPVATDLIASGRTFARPVTLAQALELVRAHPDAAVVAGCTDWGIAVNLGAKRAEYTIAIGRLPELRNLEIASDCIELGAALTLTEIDRQLDGRIPLLSQLFPQFASPLIRNSATLGGNLGTGSPIGDCAPALLALQATIVLVGSAGEREIALADYFTGYRRSVRHADELIRCIRIPLPLANTVAFHKIAKRRFDDISSVAVAYSLDIADGVIRAARIGVGGVAATPVRAYRTESVLQGRPWSIRTVEEASRQLRIEGTPIDDHRASARYRSAMLGNSLLKLFAQKTEVTAS